MPNNGEWSFLVLDVCVMRVRVDGRVLDVLTLGDLDTHVPLGGYPLFPNIPTEYMVLTDPPVLTE